MSKKAIIFSIITGIAFAVALFVLPAPMRVEGDTTSNDLTGYLWSSNIGWISLNSNDPGTGAETDQYKVTMNNGTLEGYAWSPNVGWLRFGSDLTGPTGGGDSFGAKVVEEGGKKWVKGWARFCAVYQDQTTCSGTEKNINGTSLGGWDGWVKMVNVEYTPGSPSGIFKGFAWGGLNVGWISFSYPQVVNPDDDEICNGRDDDHDSQVDEGLVCGGGPGGSSCSVETKHSESFFGDPSDPFVIGDDVIFNAVTSLSEPVTYDWATENCTSGTSDIIGSNQEESFLIPGEGRINGCVKVSNTSDSKSCEGGINVEIDKVRLNVECLGDGQVNADGSKICDSSDRKGTKIYPTGDTASLVPVGNIGDFCWSGLGTDGGCSEPDATTKAVSCLMDRTRTVQANFNCNASCTMELSPVANSIRFDSDGSYVDEDGNPGQASLINAQVVLTNCTGQTPSFQVFDAASGTLVPSDVVNSTCNGNSTCNLSSGTAEIGVRFYQEPTGLEPGQLVHPFRVRVTLGAAGSVDIPMLFTRSVGN